MPHKHKRKGGDDSIYDLPPSARAKSLSSRDAATLSDNFASKTKQRKDKKRAKRIAGYGADDTPKAFARLMKLSQTGKGFNKGLDNGDEPRGKKRKLNGEENKTLETNNASQPVPEMPKILPGEKMSDFAARVDKALPVAGLARKGIHLEGVKERQTKTEKRIQKMISQWREEEEKIKDREQEERDLAEIEDDEQEAMWEDKTAPIPTKGGKKKGKRKGGDEEDPWAVLKAKREEPKGLNDVVQAPPTFKAIPKEKFKVKNGAKVQVADIPNAAGSLRRREELGEARKSVIESYRAMMSAKKNGA